MKMACIDPFLRVAMDAARPGNWELGQWKFQKVEQVQCKGIIKYQHLDISIFAPINV